MSFGGTWRGVGREVFLALSAMALALMLVVPPGFMVGGGDGPARIVICTGHGGVDSVRDLGHAPKGGKASPACAFAGHGAPPTLGPSGPSISAWLALRAALVAIPVDQVRIGAGLAAPPPARAPPSFPRSIV
jgi:hypothetical protein